MIQRSTNYVARQNCNIDACLRFYAAEVCLVLKFLHENGIIYRAVKLDNILLTSEGHIKVIDFITSAEGIHDHYGTTTSFRGTCEFITPEVNYLDHRKQLHNRKT
jgi:serine/threonine protein kinase